MSHAVIAAIHGRRSVGKVAPDPLPRELVEELLRAAVAAPNHHLTNPWRFVVLAGAARHAVGEAHARAVARAKPEHPQAGLLKEAARLERAPVVIAVAVAGTEDHVQAREDRDAVAAAVQNLLLAAHAEGLAAIWRTGVMADEPEVAQALGLADGDALVGMVYLGRPLPGATEPPAPERAPLEAVVRWRGW